MPAIGLLLLAAGTSSRMGGDLPKQLLPYRGRSLLRHSVETALASQCRPIVVVLGAQAERLQKEVAALPVATTIASRWEQGMGASIHAGLAFLETRVTSASLLDGVIISLCDQPLMTASHLDALTEAAAENPAVLVASEYGGTLGVPALFPRGLFPDLLALPETKGAKSILSRNASHAIRIPFPEGLRDLDTLEDYQKLLNERGGG